MLCKECFDKFSELVCTDPDNDQWREWYGGNTFRFSQGNTQAVIDMNDIDPEEIEFDLAAFSGIDQGIEKGTLEWFAIAAECHFELNYL